jgi:flagellar FliL protein
MADPKTKAQEVPAAPAAPATSAKNPLVTLLLLLNLVVMGAVAFLQFKSFQKISTEPSIQDVVKAEMKSAAEAANAKSDGTKEEAPNEGQLFPLEGFTANLAQGDGPRRFVRLNVVLKFNPEAKETEFKARKPQIRDSIISILNAKRPEDLLKKEGKTYLKEEIKASINSFLIDGRVEDIYYVGFQIN